jgi:uncharacterized ferritin-like protein (DUF455 family)
MIARLSVRVANSDEFAKWNLNLEKTAQWQNRPLHFVAEPFDIPVATESDLMKLVDDVLAVAGSRHGDSPVLAELLLRAGSDVPARPRA